MIVYDLAWHSTEGWTTAHADPASHWVLYFASRAALQSDASIYAGLREKFPLACLIGCSTGGQICGDDMDDETPVAVAVKFERTRLKFHAAEIAAGADSRAVGREIGERLDAADLAGIFLLSDGLAVNGSELVAGIVAAIGSLAPVCGGLAGDGSQFAATLVGADALPRANVIAALGFYGDKTVIGSGSAGGWSVFGPRRVITKARDNVLYELDGQRALDLYLRYLGPEDSAELPGSALLYPLRIRDPENTAEEIVRTVLGVDFDEGSMRFAGNMPLGWSAELMRGSRDGLVAGAGAAARQAIASKGPRSGEGLAVIISCIGRRLLMGQSVYEEIEAASSMLGGRYHKIGFYSYGEISPHAATGAPVLHNQTMTLMTLGEAA